MKLNHFFQHFQAVGRDNEAFVFLNHYLDICEAIEEGNSELIDSSDFSATDFPSEVPLPAHPALNSIQHEEVKDWVLSVSMDQRIDQVCPKKPKFLIYPLHMRKFLF